MHGLREFSSASELLAFYAGLRERMQNLPPPKPKPVPVVVERVPQPYPFVRVQVERVRRTPMERILIAVSRQFGIPVSAMRSARRTADVVTARSAAIYIGHRLLNLSLPQLGRLLGGRDHTTALHAVRSVSRRMAGNEVFSEMIEGLIKSVLVEEG